jgi:Na+/proline symporter
VGPFPTQEADTRQNADGGHWSVRGRQLGFGVLIAFTVKGICTTAMIFAAIFAAADDGALAMMPHVLLWTVACIGGFCMLGGWRRLRDSDARAEAVHETGAAGKQID